MANKTRNNIRKEIWIILKDLENEKVTTNEAYHLLCDLFAVSVRSEQLCENLDENYNCKNMCLTRCVDGNKFYK